MRSLQLTLTVLALAATARGQNPPCWFEDMCSFDQNADVNTVIDKVAFATLDDQLVECQRLCFAEASCDYFTVFNTGGARGNVFCYQLAACDHTDATCIETGTCGSGPGDCDLNTNCPVLDAATMAGDDTIRWHCDNTDPYTEETPEGETCRLFCAAWEDDDGKSATIQSTCQGADPTQKWSNSEAVGTGGDAVIFPELNADAASRPRPDSVAADQRVCGCPPFNMEWTLEDGNTVDYDPNSLPGKSWRHADITCTLKKLKIELSFSGNKNKFD